MELRIKGHPTCTIEPGQAWFESGRETAQDIGRIPTPFAGYAAGW
jgi:hypothetical protein